MSSVKNLILLSIAVFSVIGISGSILLAQSRMSEHSPATISMRDVKSALPADDQVNRLADRYVAEQLAFDPTLSAFTGLRPADLNRFAERSPSSIAALADQERADLIALSAVKQKDLSSSAATTYANLLEQLQSDIGMRVCRTELWNVSHYGWTSQLATVAEAQPINTDFERKAAIERWSSLGKFVNFEISNLSAGLAEGYSAPASLVRRVIQQIDQLVPADPSQSPFYSPAARSNDATFRHRFRAVIVEQVNPALVKYRDFLRTDYLPKARNGTAILDLPDGSACYRAFLRTNTTLRRTPQEVFDLGQKTVDANLAYVQSLGSRVYGTRDVPTMLAAIQSKPSEHFRSPDDLISFSNAFIARSEAKTRESLIDHMPKQRVVVRPLPAFEEASGVNSRFLQEPDPAKPSSFLIQLGVWKTETRAEAEIVAIHETIPGHGLQKAIAAELAPPTSLSRLIDNAAYVEGWARYAEAMGEQADIYGFEGGDAPDAIILRRLWPARGMVVDPGLNAFGWTREQAITYIMSAGRDTRESADDLVDRIAAMPGQLTSYDTGGLEILSLRHEAESALGSRFDPRAFNHAVLGQGVVTLSELRRRVELWVNLRSLKP